MKQGKDQTSRRNLQGKDPVACTGSLVYPGTEKTTTAQQAPGGWSKVRGQAEARSWKGVQNVAKGLDFTLNAMETFEARK